MGISVIHPTRSRAHKSLETINNWIKNRCKCGVDCEFIVSLDRDDPQLLEYKSLYEKYVDVTIIIHDNMSSVQAINRSVAYCNYDIFMVVSDDTESYKCWDCKIEEETSGKIDFIMKTKDGIQDWLITFPIIHRAYYNRFGYIYHPDYLHLFADTELTCVADILGRKITSNLLFPHNHYSIGKATLDGVYSKNDRTNEQGEKLFLERYARNFDLPPGNKIQDRGMIEWLKKRNRA